MKLPTCLTAKLPTWTGLLALGLISAPLVAQPAEVPSTAMVYLVNGDRVIGSLDSSDDAAKVRWKSPLFRDSIDFDIRGVSHILFGPQPQKAKPALSPLAAGVFDLLNQLPRGPADQLPLGSRVELAGRQVLWGTVESLDEGYLNVDSRRHGKLRINRSSVIELDGLASGTSMVFDGSGSLAAWSALGGPDRSAWRLEGRELVTTTSGASLYHQPAKVTRFVYELELAGRGQPNFRLVFGAGPSLNDIPYGYSLETWGRDLVAHREADGEPLVSWSPRPKWQSPNWSLALKAYLDPEARRLAVYSQGKLLVELKTERQPPVKHAGLLIRNQGRELRVTKARIRATVGPSSPVDDSDDLVVLTDGTSLNGQIGAWDRQKNQLLITTADGPQTLPADRVDRIRLSAPSDSETVDATTASLQLGYLDGGSVRGRYLRVDDSGIWLETDFSDVPIPAALSNLHEVRFGCEDPPDPPPTKKALIEHSTSVLHGRVVNGDGPAGLLWEAVYSEDPVMFADTRTTRVSLQPQENRVAADQLTSELSLTNGDTIPCQIEAIDEQAVVARFAAGETVRVPREHFKALRDFRPENWIYSGFVAGDRWYADQNDTSSFRLRDGALELTSAVRLAREMPFPDRFRISFDVHFRSNANLVVGVGSDTLQHALDRPERRGINGDMLKAAMNEKPDTLIEMTITRNGPAIRAHGLSRAAGILSMFFRGNMFRGQQRPNVNVAAGDNGTVHIEWLIDRPGREYVITGNGQEMYRWRDPTPWEGRVLHFGCQRADDNGQPADSDSVGGPIVSIYNFRIDRWPGEMESDHRDRFLTRRRGASREAMTHALRAANGDSLRGRLIGMSDEQIVFQSRLETLTIPRAAVVEIISLEPVSPPSSASDKAESGESVRLALWGGKAMTLTELRATERYIMGQSPLAGPVSVPWSAVSMVQFGRSSNRPPSILQWVLRDPPPLPTPDESTPEEPSPWLDRPAPDFKITLLDGRKLELAELRGKPVILDFWATWCGPCIASMPTLLEVAEELDGKVELIAINLQEDRDEVQAFVESRLWHLRVGLDLDGSLGHLLGVNGIPYTLILDRDGVVRHAHLGASPDLKDELTGILKGLIDP